MNCWTFWSLRVNGSECRCWCAHLRAGSNCCARAPTRWFVIASRRISPTSIRPLLSWKSLPNTAFGRCALPPLRSRPTFISNGRSSLSSRPPAWIGERKKFVTFFLKFKQRRQRDCWWNRSIWNLSQTPLVPSDCLKSNSGHCLLKAESFAWLMCLYKICPGWSDSNLDTVFSGFLGGGGGVRLIFRMFDWLNDWLFGFWV